MVTKWSLVGLGIACIVAAVVGGGMTIFGNQVPVLTSKKRQVLLALVGALCMIIGFTFNPDPAPPEIVDTPQAMAGEAHHMELLTKWKESKKYVIEAATSYVNIEDTATTRHSTTRMVYAVRALKDIKPEEGIFKEYFDSEGTPTHWPGTQPEDFTDKKNVSRFAVDIGLQKDGLLAFETGQDSVLNLPMRSGRPSCIPKETLDKDTDYYSYSVGDGDDIVHTLTMVITSKTTALTAKAVMLYDSNPKPPTESKIAPLIQQSEGWYTISATWSYVQPKQTACIIVGW